MLPVIPWGILAFLYEVTHRKHKVLKLHCSASSNLGNSCYTRPVSAEFVNNRGFKGIKFFCFMEMGGLTEGKGTNKCFHGDKGSK